MWKRRLLDDIAEWDGHESSTLEGLLSFGHECMSLSIALQPTRTDCSRDGEPPILLGFACKSGRNSRLLSEINDSVETGAVKEGRAIVSQYEKPLFGVVRKPWGLVSAIIRQECPLQRWLNG